MAPSASSSSLHLRKFDPRSFGGYRVFGVIGRRGSGKTTLMLDLMYHYRHIESGVIFSPTESASKPTWSKHCPALFIHSEYNPDVIRNIVKNQRRIAKTGAEPPGVFVVLDDCMYNKNAISNDKYMRYIFQNGRHNGIHLVIAAQYLMDLSPPLRGNIDVVFACSENNDVTRKKIWSNFFGYFDAPTFKQVFAQVTRNFGVLVGDNTKPGASRPEDVCFWYKAEEHPSFRIGSIEFWKFHLKHFDPDADSGSDSDAPDAAAPRGRRAVTVVRRGRAPPREDAADSGESVSSSGG